MDRAWNFKSKRVCRRGKYDYRNMWSSKKYDNIGESNQKSVQAYEHLGI